MQSSIERIVNLVEPGLNRIHNMEVERATHLVATGDATGVRTIDGSFALVGYQEPFVRMARSLDRPMRYFLAKLVDGPLLVVADRIDTIARYLAERGIDEQFHPSYTRMVPAHHVLTLHLIGCPDPQPSLTRFFTPRRNQLAPSIESLGAQYMGALASEIGKWLDGVGDSEPVGVCFSGGIDSGSVFLLTYHLMRRRGMNLGRLKAFTLDLGDGPDLEQARAFLDALDLGLFLEPIEARIDDPSALLDEVVAVVEDYKPLDVEAAAMTTLLVRGIRARYPDWVRLIDGDGGDENLKDYPLEDGGELTVRSVLNNRLLYQEGWGVDSIKHSLTYTGGQSRACTRTYAPARAYGFENFSPYTRPAVIEVAEGIPFIGLTGYDVEKLFALKGQIVASGIREITGFDMPAFEKRRFQHGAMSERQLRETLPVTERTLRRRFLALHA
jgi:asparagine synthase (glutamine-hydrolysing)